MHERENDLNALRRNHSCLLTTVKMRCFQMQKIRGIVSGGEASALIQKEVLILTDEERQSLLDKAEISSSIELGAAEILAMKAGLAIPWNKLIKASKAVCHNIQQRYQF